MLIREQTATLSAEERQRLLLQGCGADLEEASASPSCRCHHAQTHHPRCVSAVVARVEDDEIQLLLHWQGRDPRPPHRWREPSRVQPAGSVGPKTVDLIDMRTLMPDKAVGLLDPIRKAEQPLNQVAQIAGTWLPQTRTPSQSTWKAESVCAEDHVEQSSRKMLIGVPSQCCAVHARRHSRRAILWGTISDLNDWVSRIRISSNASRRAAELPSSPDKDQQTLSSIT